MYPLKTIAAGLVCFATAICIHAQTPTKAPDFTGVDANGQKHSLAELKGKIVVLEFTNPGSPVSNKPGCPYMVPRYENKIMQNLAAKVQQAGGVYLAVNSNYYNTAADSQAIAKKYGVTYPILIDSEGTIGKAFAAKTTPDMVVINKDGNIVYQGALDDNATPDTSKEASATNYVLAAIDAAQKGTTPAITQTKSYGCGIKYKNQ
jgi:peroxiredoxin